MPSLPNNSDPKAYGHGPKRKRRRHRHHLHRALFRALCVTIALYVLVQLTPPHQALSRRNDFVPLGGTQDESATTATSNNPRGEAQLQQEGGTNLGNNRLTTQTDVSYQAAIAYDIMEIYKALRQDNYDRVYDVYTKGENSLNFALSETQEEGGVEYAYRSLSAMSKSFAIDKEASGAVGEEVHNVMKGLNYYFTIYGLAKGDVDIVSHYNVYADSYIKELLNKNHKAGRKMNNDDGNSSVLAGEAMVVLNLWMFATHKVWSSLAHCRGGYGHSRPTQEQQGSPQIQPNEAAIQSLDEFVAYWYGLGFDNNSNNNLKEESGMIMTDLHPHGYLLYDITEKASNYFGTSFLYSDIGKEARVNTNIHTLYSKIISLLLEPSTCYNPDATDDLPTTSSNYQEFYKAIQQLISQMQVPLLQHLVHALYIDDDKERIQLYAMSIVPQLISVSKTAHGYLQSKLIDNVENYNSSEDFMNVMKAIYSTLPPLGISCDDIGQYYQTTQENNDDGGRRAFPPCIDPSSNSYPHTLANFNPTTKSTIYTSTIDLDILQIKTLMKSGAHSSARWIYESGRHSLQTLNSDEGFMMGISDGSSSSSNIYQSLKQMATNRDILLKNTWYGNYVAYMNNDIFFGDTLVSSVLSLSEEELREGQQQHQNNDEDGTERTKWRSISQHTEVVSKTLQFLVLHQYAISLMYLAVEQCVAALSRENTQVSRAGNEQQQSSLSSTHHIEQIWDEAASYLIGSLEGQYESDSGVSYMHDEIYDRQYGFSLYALANARCSEFNTCSSSFDNSEESSFAPERAKIVLPYRDLLNTGKGQIESLQCDELKQKTVKQIQRWSLIPIIQSILRYAIKGAELKKVGSKLKLLAEGEIFALVILPLLYDQQDENVGQQSSSAGASTLAHVEDMEEVGDKPVDTEQNIIERNMIVQPDVKPVQDGPQEVAKALSAVVEELGLPCEFIGDASGVSPCNFIQKEGEAGVLQEGDSSSSDSKSRIPITWIVVGSSLAIGGLSIFYPYAKRCWGVCRHIMPI